MTAGGPQPRPATAVSALFPTAVVAYEVVGEPDDAMELSLHPAERELIASAVPGRRREFAAARLCARHGLQSLGVETPPILRGERRQPLWPPGAVGSISHTDGYAVAVVASRSTAELTVGVDAEQVGRVEPHLHERLFTSAERDRLAGLSEEERDRAATSMFGAKESFYKAQFPLTGAWVGFHDVETTPDGDGLLLRPVSDLAALAAVRWPVGAHHDMATGSILVSGVVVVAATAKPEPR